MIYSPALTDNTKRSEDIKQQYLESETGFLICLPVTEPASATAMLYRALWADPYQEV